MGGVQLDVVRSRRVVDLHLRGAFPRRLQRLGHHGGDDLPAVVDRVRLEEHELTVVDLRQARRVVVRDDRQHAGERKRALGVDRVDLAGRDGGGDGGGVGDSLGGLLEGVAGLAGDLGVALDPAHRSAHALRGDAHSANSESVRISTLRANGTLKALSRSG